MLDYGVTKFKEENAYHDLCLKKKSRDIQIHFSTSLLCISISELMNDLL